MRASLVVLLCLLLPGCADILGSKDGDGGASSSDAGSDGSAQVQGAYCGVEPTTGQTLCAAISTCPQVIIDRDLFPNCGYRVNGSALDMQCACDGYLCPMGTPSTCAQAKTLLGQQTEAEICTQVNQGRCLQLKKPGGNGGSSTCDQTCASECNGNATCRQLCGC
jgi:hypothetical protein